MVIQNMFVEDINRKINGVVKVDEDENKVLEQELNEYVITRELKRHHCLQRGRCLCFTRVHLTTSSCGCSTV